MIDTKNIDEARSLIKKAKKPVVVKSQDEKFNRKILESGGFDVLLSPEKSSEKKSLRQINSGFNHVLARIATQKNIAIGIDLNEIRSLDIEDKAESLEKIRQNIVICRKANTPLYIIGDKKEGFHLLLSLGSSTTQAKIAITQCF